MGTVSTLKPRTSLRVVEPTPKLPLVETHTVLPAGARNAMANLDGKVNALRRIFAGPSTPVAMLAKIADLTLEIQTEAQRIRRLSRTN